MFFFFLLIFRATTPRQPAAAFASSFFTPPDTLCFSCQFISASDVDMLLLVTSFADAMMLPYDADAAFSDIIARFR